MARPLRIEYPGAFYHVTARGNERKDIYRDDKDRERFLSYVETSVIRYKAEIHVYCLMSNHYHFLLSTPSGNLSQIMRHINGAYTAYFNKRHGRFGHLFQGRYKALLVDADEYAGELSRYIHLNPVRAGLVQRPEKYIWMSYPYYTGMKKTPRWLTTDWLLRYFGSPSDDRKEYRAFVEAKIGAEGESPLKDAVASTLLGRPDFIDDIKEKYLGGRKKNRDLPALAILTQVTPESILKAVNHELKDRPEDVKKAAIYLSHRFSSFSLKEVGQQFGIGELAVSQASRRFEAFISEDKKLRKRVEKVKQSLKVCNV